MEEKERYKIDKSTNYYTNTIVDTKTNKSSYRRKQC